MTAMLKNLYNLLLRNRRLRRLTAILAPIIPQESLVLDLGCGNAELAQALKQQVLGLSITGIDVMMRSEQNSVPVHTYDGKTIPFPDDTFDYVMLITVLHHTDNYIPVLQEALRVARKGVVLMDHQYSGLLQWCILAFIDWPGNVPFGVYTPFNFKNRKEWLELFEKLNLKEIYYNDRLYLFGKWFDFLLGRRMHFVNVLHKKRI